MTSHTSSQHDAYDLGVIGVALPSLATLPQAFEQYPKGGATVAVLIVVALICWVIVTWLKNRRS